MFIEKLFLSRKIAFLKSSSIDIQIRMTSNPNIEILSLNTANYIVDADGGESLFAWVETLKHTKTITDGIAIFDVVVCHNRESVPI